MTVARKPQRAAGIRRPLKALAWVAVGAAAAFTLWAVGDLLVLVFAGILFAVFLDATAELLQRLARVPAAWSLPLAVLLLLVVLVVLGGVLGSEVVEQMDQLVPSLHTSWQHAEQQLRGYEWGRALLDSANLRVLFQDRGWMAKITGGVFSGALGVVVGLLIVVFLGLYAAVAPRLYLDGALRLIPRAGRRRAREILDAVGSTLRWWLIGTLVKMALVGIATTIGLLLLDMPLALALGTIALLLEFIPYVGPVLAAIPALLVALALGPMQALYVGLLYLAIQMAENYVISPLVDQRSVHLPPVLTIVAQLLLGASPLGVLGVFFATPLTAVAIVLIRTLYIEDRLGERADQPL